MTQESRILSWFWSLLSLLVLSRSAPIGSITYSMSSVGGNPTAVKPRKAQPST